MPFQPEYDGLSFVAAEQKRNTERVSVMRTFHILVRVAFLSRAFSFAPPRANHRPRSSMYAERLPEINVAVVGGGPSGLLLSHFLLEQENIRVTLLEGRTDPRDDYKEQRAYPLGIGIRGRTAIRGVDEDLWRAVKKRGFESERFQLHIGGFVIPLRSEKDGGEGVEPSLLTFQSELCAALAEALDVRHRQSGRLQLKFGTKAEVCDLDKMQITTDSGLRLGTYDLIIGCDGVNSQVRSAITERSPAFESTKALLPGELKAVRLDNAPPTVDPTAVSLILPRKGSAGAFVEPTGVDGSCCILFSGRGDTPILNETKNMTAIVEALEGAFPAWGNYHDKIAQQLMAQTVPYKASSVVCNIYNYGGKVALVGDAAHATGGISGQGVNSALVDSVVLANCIKENRHDLLEGLFSYSLRQVPEGKALYDLSFGPKPKGFKGIRWGLKNVLDLLFGGRFGIGQQPLQTKLTTDLMPFAEIRRTRDEFYDKPFPSDNEVKAELRALHEHLIRYEQSQSLLSDETESA